MDADKQRIAELVLEIQGGNSNAFNELYKLTSSRAYFVALQITKNEEDAQDILQDCYIKALEKINTLDKPESFVSWFHQMVANRSKDLLKKKKPSLFEGGEDEAFEVIPDEDEAFVPEKNLDQTELHGAIMEAIDELSEEKRACVLMMYFEEMSVNEIAQSLEVPVSTVKNRLFTARKDLKNSFEKRGITSVYSAAPIGAVIWALTLLSDSVSKTFSGSAASSQVLAGVTAATAGTAATAAAGGAAAAGTGIAAKVAAFTVAQKVIAGIAVAGVVTGSAVGVTTVIKNNRENETTAAPTYIEEVTTSPITAEMVFATVSETETSQTDVSSSAVTERTALTTKKEPTATTARHTTQKQTRTEPSTVGSTKKTRPSTTRRDYSLDYTKATTSVPSTAAVTTTQKTTAAKTTTTREETTEKETERTTKATTAATTAKATTTEATTTEPQVATLVIDIINYDDEVEDTLTLEIPAGTTMSWDYLMELVRSNGYEAESGVYGDARDTQAVAGETYSFRAEL